MSDKPKMAQAIFVINTNYIRPSRLEKKKKKNK